MIDEINNNYQNILDKINIACKKSNRDPNSVKLIAICKRQPVLKINRSINLGIKYFGENRIQDAYNRWSKLETKVFNLSFIRTSSSYHQGISGISISFPLLSFPLVLNTFCNGG